MKTLTKSILAIEAFFLMVTFRALAIEDLRVAIQNTNVVLSWPSTNGETYVVQYRSAFSTNTPWTTLTNNMPPASGTNRTKYTVVGVVPPPAQGGGGGGGSGGPPSLQSAASPSDSHDNGRSGGRHHPTTPPLPPCPWDPSTWPQAGNSPSAGGSSGELSAQDSGGGGSGMFYRVVRTGLRVIGLAQNSVISGTVPMEFELGIDPPTDVLTGLYIRGSQEPSFTGLEVSDITTEFLRAAWDTTCVGNGAYTLIPGVQLGPYVEYDGTSVAVTVSNLVRFPNLWPVAGEAMRIEAQTAHTNGTWRMDIYGDQNNHLATLQGPVDTAGYCNYPPFPGPGFSLSLLDNFGNQLPYNFYVVNVTTFAAAGQTPPQATAKVTNFVEQSWWGQRTWFNVAYIPIYGDTSLNAQNLKQMMVDVFVAAKSRYPDYPEAVQLGSETEPWRLLGPSEWAELAVSLTNNFGTRNLYYFGHGAPSYIGVGNTNQQINIADLNAILRNAADPLKGTNGHPYRFVFLDGCKTANGNLPPAFGIPKGSVPVEEFTAKRGLRPRAFLGWDNGVMITWGTFDLSHATFVPSFFDKWANSRTPQGDPLSVQQAITASDPQSWAQKSHMVVHGCPTLFWMDDQLLPP